MPVIIKGTVLGQGKPVICVPIVETTKDAIIEEARRLLAKDVRMLEWRADFFEGLREPEELRSVLEILRDMAAKTILLVTIRTKAQGGEAELSPVQMEELLLQIARSHCADLIDVEYFTCTDPKVTVTSLQEQGVNVVLSHHDIKGTPKDMVMEKLLDTMTEIDADIIKLAVMPENTADVLRLLSATNGFRERHKGVPIITMAMGRRGMISRISGELFGSCVTFGMSEKASAPGQIPWEDLGDVLDFIHYYG